MNVTQAEIEAMVPKVLSMARQLSARVPWWVDAGDMQAAGLEGLVLASIRYRPGKGATFRTYAYITARGAIIRSIREQTRVTCRVPRRALEAWAAARRRGEDGEEFQPLPPFSLDEPLDSDMGEPLPLSEAVSGPGDPYADADQCMDAERLLAVLKPRERVLLWMRYAEQQSQSEVADALGLSQMQISRLERRALETLRAEVGA